MSFVTLTGIIQEDGYVLTDDGKKYPLPQRGIDKEGYPEVLINAKSVGGSGFFYRQSIKPYIGMKAEFVADPDNIHYGIDYCKILKDNLL